MNIALIGFGKMGQLIKKIAESKGHKISSIIDPNCDGCENEINEQSVKDADVCIDFSHPSIAIGNIKKLAELKKNIVMGTTGWYDHKDEVKKVVEESNIGFIWSGNFSIGVNILFRIIEHASKIINNVTDYDIYSYEMHHNKKADSPSGTAVMIGNILKDNIERKSSLVYDKIDRQIKEDEIHIASVRGGNIPGIHVVGFDSKADTIELKHSARDRSGFASGAVLAAEFIKDKKGFYNINNMMDNLLEG